MTSTNHGKPLSGYAMVPGWLIELRPPSPALHAYVVLAMFATFQPGLGQYTSAYPCRETVAGLMGCSLSTVKRALAWLVDAGAAIRTVRYGEGGEQLPSMYRLAFGALVGPDPNPRVTSEPGGRVTSEPGGGSPVSHNPEPLYPEPFDPEETVATAPVSAEQQEAPKREDITASWIDYCSAHDVRLSPVQIKRYAAKIKELRSGRIPDDIIKRALGAMFDDRVVSRPALLDNYVTRVQQGPERGPRRLTRTEETMQDTVSPDAMALLAQTLTNQNTQQSIGSS